MQLVRNQGRRNHRAVIAALLKSCNRAVLCSGWMKVEGVKALLPAIDCALSNGATLTIYSSEKETLPDAAAAIPNRPGLHHLIVPNHGAYLHSKLYYFEQGAKYTALVGSANITYGGLVSNEELSIKFSGIVGDDKHRELVKYIDNLRKLWETPVVSEAVAYSGRAE